jgi:hypothetical protein
MTIIDSPITTPERTVNPPDANDRRFDSILGRIDLFAVLTLVLGMAILALMGLAMAAVGLARLLLILWGDSAARWPVVALGLALVWVVARRKRLCIW